MKVLIIALLVGVAYAEVSLHAVLQSKWRNFKATHGKNYEAHEESQRLNAYLENSLHIETHNERHAKGQETFTMAHNQFSDMTIEEFKVRHTGLTMPPSDHIGNATSFRRPSALSIPASVDWRGILPAVKNQGSCGSCYAFASLAPLEGQLNRRFGGIHSLSEQEIVDCTLNHGNNGCGGGWMTGVYNYIQQKGGVNTENNYRYAGAVQNCSPGSSRTGRIARYVNVNNENDMTNALATVGPVAIALQAGVRSFSMYSGGVYTDRTCGSGNIDHGVTAVGYGVADGIPYYTIRNSWGTGWGEGGHMRIARNIRHVANYGYYPVV